MNGSVENNNASGTQGSSTESSGNKPDAKFKYGAMKATVWKNVDKKNNDIVHYSVDLQRTYKDKNDQWQQTSSVGEGDLPKAILAMQEAYKYILETKENK